MSVAVFVNKPSEARDLIGWGIRLAQSTHAELLVIVPRRQSGPVTWDALHRNERDENEVYEAVFATIDQHDSATVVLKEAIAEGGEASDYDRVAIETRELVAPNPETAFAELADSLSISQLIVPRSDSGQTHHGEGDWSAKLFRDASCQTVVLRGAAPPPEQPLRVLVAADSDTYAKFAIKQARRLAQHPAGGSLTFLYIRPDDDPVASQIAKLHTERLFSGSDSDSSPDDRRVHLGESFSGAIRAQDLSQFDLVLTGNLSLRKLKKFFRIADEPDTPAIAAIRPGRSVGNLVWRSVQSAVRNRVPQLDREMRVRVVDKLQTGSSFNFDFCALIALSTLIAALGLVDNSAAVVIGAMLVAPLMTPLIGTGFALVQGNGRLVKTAVNAVGLGFAVAFLIGCLVGLMATVFTDLPISTEMAARDAPSLLDLAIALASGIAGAYALSRPDLLSALPGVAIAAALVPPIATSGMALTMGEPILCGGALLLFLTNIVFIVLGTAVTFWAVGVDTRPASSENSSNHSERSGATWPRYWFAAFVVISMLLATEMAIFNPLKRTPVADPPSAAAEANNADGTNE